MLKNWSSRWQACQWPYSGAERLATSIARWTQLRRRCWAVSCSWWQSGQAAWWGRPCLARRSAVQMRCLMANQRKNLQHKGAQLLQIRLQGGNLMELTKQAAYKLFCCYKNLTDLTDQIRPAVDTPSTPELIKNLWCQEPTLYSVVLELLSTFSPLLVQLWIGG